MKSKYADTKLVLVVASAGEALDGSVKALSVRLNARGIPHLVDDPPAGLVSPNAAAAPPRSDASQVWLWVPEPALASARQVIGEWAADPSLKALERAPIPPEDKGPGCLLHGGGKHYWKCPTCTGYNCDRCGIGVMLRHDLTICRGCAARAIHDGRRTILRLWKVIAALSVGLWLAVLLALVSGASASVLVDRVRQGYHRVLGR